ncbi:hypothetical protein TIFTF001_002133 [Ficus carica]|uniref:F-box associated beta-propeller type 3 domain-containing protein n=1 Tax=Ficus carica TaxID=3494 RepID=A0AA88CSP9_FICCA|nr:hypothetical protein TIFTF001_002133 [Ficus carica]
MTRRKITACDGTRICNYTTDGQIRRIRRSCMMDIPTEVLASNILMKLPLKSLVSCKRPEDEFSEELRYWGLLELSSTRLKIPLSSTHVNVLNNVSQGHDDHPQGKNILVNRFMKPEDQQYRILNSLNGLLCLAAGRSNEPVAVCNPVVGEFTALPVRPRIDHQRIKFETCGLGFSQKHNQYKVIRTFDLRLAKDPDSCDFTNQGTWGEVLTLGTGSSWKSVGSAPITRESIAYFDLDNDKFGFHSLPPPRYSQRTPLLTVSILEDCLCLCDFTKYAYIDVWIMKEYGVSKSWTKLISIHNFLQGYHFGYYQPLSYSIEHGTLLLFHSSNALIYYEPEFLYTRTFEVRGPHRFEFKAIVHIPSLISLKDVANSRYR